MTLNLRSAVTFLISGGTLFAFPGLFGASAVQAAETPIVGDCYYAPASALNELWSDYPSIDCSQPHTLETYRVRKWSAGNPYTMSESRLTEIADAACGGTAIYDYLGIAQAKAPTSRINWYWFVPSEEQWNSGERWIRCDVGLRRGWGGLQSFRGSMSSAMARGGVTAWAWCTKQEPIKYDLQAPVPCASSDRPWILAKSSKLRGQTYPGHENVRNQASAFCEYVAVSVGVVTEPAWGVWWTSEERWNAERAGYAWCYVRLSDTKWG